MRTTQHGDKHGMGVFSCLFVIKRPTHNRCSNNEKLPEDTAEVVGTIQQQWGEGWLCYAIYVCTNATTAVSTPLDSDGTHSRPTTLN